MNHFYNLLFGVFGLFLKERMSLQGKEILIVDDMPDVRLICRKILENLGVTVLVADSGAQALTLLAEKVPHLIVLDLEMPGMTGFDFLAIRKNTPQLAAIPIVVSSGLTDKESIYKAMALGANDYILKPVNASIMSQRIRKHIRDLDFKRYRFKENEQPKAWLNINAMISRIAETSLNLESPVRLEVDSQILLSMETLSSTGLKDCVLVTSPPVGARNPSGLYTSRVNAVGIKKTLT
jgi:CheY-like chemotaxis protein